MGYVSDAMKTVEGIKPAMDIKCPCPSFQTSE